MAAHRRARWILLSILGFLLLAFAACEIAGWPFLRGPAEKVLSRQLERPVRIAGPFRLHLLGGVGLQAGGLWIAAPEGFDSPHFLDARDLLLKLRYADLWAMREGGPLRVAALEVGQLDARLVRRDDGRATWQFGPPKQDEPQPPPAVDRLGVRKGTVILRDPTQGVDLRVRFDTQEGAAAAEPVSHAAAEGELRERPFRGELTTNGWLPVAAQDPSVRPLAAQGWLDYGGVRVDFDGEAADLLGLQGIKGAVSVKGPSLALLGRLIGSPLPTTGRFLIEGTVEKHQEKWSTVVKAARVGSSRLAGRFTYDAAPEPPRLEGELSGSRFVLADLGPAFGTRDEDGRPVPPPPGRVIPVRPLDLPELKNLDARIAVNLERVELGDLFAEPITPLKGTLDLEAGRLALSDVDARTARGRLKGDVSVDTKPEVPRWRSELAWEGIRLEDWFAAAKARGEDADEPPSPPYFTGRLHGRAKLAGAGDSTAEVLGSLHGDATLWVREGSMSHLVIELLGLDVAQGLGLVMRGDESLPVRCGVLDIQARNGDVVPRVGLIDTPVTLVLIDGAVELDRERLDLRVSARPKNVSPLTLRSPLRVRGSFADPAVRPEAAPLTAKILGGIALAFINPLTAILPFVDPGEEQASPCTRSLESLRAAPEQGRARRR